MAEEPASVDEAGLAVWNKLFQALRDQHKAPILACIQNARFMGMTASQFQMRMQSGLMASLVMRNYRKTIERILQELTGRELRLVCSGEDAPMKLRRVRGLSHRRLRQSARPRPSSRSLQRSLKKSRRMSAAPSRKPLMYSVPTSLVSR